jgi:hypothetical protein
MDLEKAKKQVQVEQGRLAEREQRLASAKAELTARQDALREILVAVADGGPNDKAVGKARDEVGDATVRVQELEIIVEATRNRIPQLAAALRAAQLEAAMATFKRTMEEKLAMAAEADTAIAAAVVAIQRYIDVSRVAFSAAVEVGRGNDALRGIDHVGWTLQWRLAPLFPVGTGPFGGLLHESRSRSLVELLRSFLPAQGEAERGLADFSKDAA